MQHLCRYLCGLIILTLVFSCAEEREQVQVNLNGLWTLDKAYRNGSPTNSMEGLFLDLVDSSSAQTNMLGDTLQMDVYLEQSLIRLKGDQTLELQMQDLTDSTMDLQLRAGPHRISLKMRR